MNYLLFINKYILIFGKISIMKAFKSLSLLQFFVKTVLILHLLFLLFIFSILRGAWKRTDINSEDLTGATNLYYCVNLGYMDRGFEFVYNKDQNENGQHFYRTGIGYLEIIDKSSEFVESQVLVQSKSINVSFAKLPLVVPVSSSQKKNLVYLASVYSVSMVFYSLIIFFQLGKYIRSLIKRNSITKSNLNLLYTIGILVILLPLIKYALQHFEISWIRNNFNFEGYFIISNYSFQFYLFGIGILILAITETLRQSIKMKKELELTV